MASKIVVLKNGQQLISNVTEVVDVFNVTIKYTLEKPCLIFMADPATNPEVQITGEEKTSLNVSLFPWIPLSKEKEISIPADAVLALVDPVDGLLSMYNPDDLENKS